VSPSPRNLLLWFLRKLKTVPTEVAEDVSSHDDGPSGYQFTEYSGFAMKSLDGRHLLLELLGMAPWLQRLLRSAVSAFTAAPVPYDGWLAYNTNPVWAELSNKDAYQQYLSEWEARRRNYPPFEWPNGRKLLLEVDLTRCTQRLMRQALNTYVARQGLDWWTALFDASPSSMSLMDKWTIEKVKSIDAAEEEMYKKVCAKHDACQPSSDPHQRPTSFPRTFPSASSRPSRETPSTHIECAPAPSSPREPASLQRAGDDGVSVQDHRQPLSCHSLSALCRREDRAPRQWRPAQTAVPAGVWAKQYSEAGHHSLFPQDERGPPLSLLWRQQHHQVSPSSPIRSLPADHSHRGAAGISVSGRTPI
jgi:hypothetical protein